MFNLSLLGLLLCGSVIPLKVFQVVSHQLKRISRTWQIANTKLMCWRYVPVRVEGNKCTHFRLVGTRSPCWQVADKLKWDYLKLQSGSSYLKLCVMSWEQMDRMMHASLEVSRHSLTLLGEYQIKVCFIWWDVHCDSFVVQLFSSNT